MSIPKDGRRQSGTPAHAEPGTGPDLPVQVPDVVAAGELLRRMAGDETAEAFYRREMECCPGCEGYGLVPDRTHPAALDGFPSLAPQIDCPTCHGTGRVGLSPCLTAI